MASVIHADHFSGIFMMTESSPNESHAKEPTTGSRLLKGFLVIAIVGILGALMLPAVRTGGGAARRTQCRINLRQIMLALHNYTDTWDAFPPAYTVDADGKPLHSWRTLILPHLDQQELQELYEKIDLSKPWDDPVNAAVFENHLRVYGCPTTGADHPANHTTYLAVVTPGSCLRPGEQRPISDLTDEMAQTIVVIEVNAADAVPWMAPQDAGEALVMSFRPDSSLPHQTGTHIAMADGSVRHMSAELSAANRRALISIAGHDEITDDFDSPY